MIFDPSYPTYKMIHSLPLFWSHIYNQDKYQLSKEEKIKVNVSDYYNDGQEHLRERNKGETALEILQPCLLCEPPISSDLIHKCTCIFINLEKERKRVNEIKPITKENADLLVNIDGIILDFFQHHFSFGSKFINTTLTELLFNKIISPLFPLNTHYITNFKRRTVLNGFLVDFVLRFLVLENNFFKLDSKISEIGCSKCFTSFNIHNFLLYKDNIDINLLSENGIFNSETNNSETNNSETNNSEANNSETNNSKTNNSETNNSEANNSETNKNDNSHYETENCLLLKELENKNQEIKKFESILFPSNTKLDDNFFIDTDEELEFHIQECKIGEGGTSITYKIIDKRTKIPMCKKVLKYRQGQTTIKDAQNALKEFGILHKISHPCICKAIRINTAEKMVEENKEMTTIALFLEFVDYRLSDVLKMNISNTTKVRIVLDIVHAMNYLHKHGMMHRDLKIDNIMLNSFFETKLVDFGLAKINELVIDDFF